MYASDEPPSSVSGTSLIRGLKVYGAVEEVDLQFGFDNGIVGSKRNLTSNPESGSLSEEGQRWRSASNQALFDFRHDVGKDE